MRKPGTDPQDVQMTDVLCDFCHRQWTEDMALIEGHQGSCICGNCLSQAYREIVLHDDDEIRNQYTCTMCLEADDDRAAQSRAKEPAWRSPMYEEAYVCRRCIKLAAKALARDKDHDWSVPQG